MGMPGFQELLLILVIVLVLFGAKKIPELMKGLGSGIRSFKKEMAKDDEEEQTAQNTQINGQQQQPQNTQNTQQTAQPNTQNEQPKA